LEFITPKGGKVWNLLFGFWNFVFIFKTNPVTF
jgi:hypothetical protein